MKKLSTESPVPCRNSLCSRWCTPTGDGCRAATARAYSDDAANWWNAASRTVTTPAGMRRTHLRKHSNILKWLLIHVAGFNLSLVFRKMLGAGKPREWNDPGRVLFLAFVRLFRRRNDSTAPYRSQIFRSHRENMAKSSQSLRSNCCWRIATYTMGC